MSTVRNRQRGRRCAFDKPRTGLLFDIVDRRYEKGCANTMRHTSNTPRCEWLRLPENIRNWVSRPDVNGKPGCEQSVEKAAANLITESAYGEEEKSAIMEWLKNLL